MIRASDPIYRRAFEFLYQRLNFEQTDSISFDRPEFKIERMRRLLDPLANPHLGIPTVHVAGSKGKGSTSQFLASILTQSGYCCGCYTSPHLERIEERFAVDGRACTRGQFVELIDTVRPVVEAWDAEASHNGGTGPTFFEITTAMAMLHFRQRGADIMILEVGLGGRLDSTNVCQPTVSLITSISFDHMRQLGNTLAKIAGEKAGIIKREVPVVTGVTDQEPLRVIRAVAEQHAAPLRRLGHDFDFRYHAPAADDAHARPRMDYWRRQDGQLQCVADQVELSTLGRHQAANASLAWAACEALRDAGLTIPDDRIRQGLAQSVCPARIEILQTQPTVVLDTAHNAASIQALVHVLQESFPARPRALILAATQHKPIDEMLRLLIPEFDAIVCTQYVQNPRAMGFEALYRRAREIAESLSAATELLTAATPTQAWERARSLPDWRLICATGSFFLAAEMKSVVETRQGPS